MSRIGRVVGFRSAFAALLLLGIGCSAEVTVEFDPNPATVGQPVEVTIEVENTLPCPHELAVVTVLITTGEDSPVGATTSGLLGDDFGSDELCTFVDDPLLGVCDLLLDEVLPMEGEFEACCGAPSFADENPEICSEMAATAADPERIRELVIRRLRHHGFPVDEVLEHESAATLSGATQCTSLNISGETFLQCDLGTIPAGETATAIGTFTPQSSLTHFGYAFLQGNAACAVSENVSAGGSGCSPLAISQSVMAPTASPSALFAVVLALLGIGGLAARHRRD